MKPVPRHKFSSVKVRSEHQNLDVTYDLFTDGGQGFGGGGGAYGREELAAVEEIPVAAEEEPTEEEPMALEEAPSEEPATAESPLNGERERDIWGL